MLETHFCITTMAETDQNGLLLQSQLLKTPSLADGSYDVSAVWKVVEDLKKAGKKNVEGKAFIVGCTTNPGDCVEFQKELKDIIEDATEHAEHIEKSPIDHQREHFDVLSKDMIDLIAITGTEEKLYQDFCPMYNNNKGAQWLSATKEIKNPYYGAKMMSCGSVQKEIN